MNGKFILVVLVLLLSLKVCLAISPNEIPLGIHFGEQTANNMTSNTLDSLTHDLGFNFCYPASWVGNIDTTRFRYIKDGGLDIIPYMMDPSDLSERAAFIDYLNAHYLVVKLSDTNAFVKFNTMDPNGQFDGDWFVVPPHSNPDTFAFLDDLYFMHEMSYQRLVQYQPCLAIKAYGIDSIQDGSIVAYFNVYKENSTGRHGSVLASYPIYVDSFRTQNPKVLSLNPFSDESSSILMLTYQLKSTSVCSLAVDSIKISNTEGDLIMSGTYDQRFRQYAAQDSIPLYWMLRDDMHTDQLALAARLDSLIRDATNNRTSGMMKCVLAYVPSKEGFIKMAKPKRANCRLILSESSLTTDPVSFVDAIEANKSSYTFFGHEITTIPLRYQRATIPLILYLYSNIFLAENGESESCGGALEFLSGFIIDLFAVEKIEYNFVSLKRMLSDYLTNYLEFKKAGKAKKIGSSYIIMPVDRLTLSPAKGFVVEPIPDRKRDALALTKCCDSTWMLRALNNGRLFMDVISLEEAINLPRLYLSLARYDPDKNKIFIRPEEYPAASNINPLLQHADSMTNLMNVIDIKGGDRKTAFAIKSIINDVKLPGQQLVFPDHQEILISSDEKSVSDNSKRGISLSKYNLVVIKYKKDGSEMPVIIFSTSDENAANILEYEHGQKAWISLFIFLAWERHTSNRNRTTTQPGSWLRCLFNEPKDSNSLSAEIHAKLREVCGWLGYDEDIADDELPGWTKDMANLRPTISNLKKHVFMPNGIKEKVIVKSGTGVKRTYCLNEKLKVRINSM